jgi:hypothetical protein
MKIIKVVKILTHILLTILIILFIITGYGITNYHLIETITFGGLTKPTSYQIHINLIIPLIVFLALHIWFSLQKKYKKKFMKKQESK